MDQPWIKKKDKFLRLIPSDNCMTVRRENLIGLVYVFIYLFIYLFIYSFIHSFIQVILQLEFRKRNWKVSYNK